jgi:hypothetical protein
MKLYTANLENPVLARLIGAKAYQNFSKIGVLTFSPARLPVKRNRLGRKEKSNVLFIYMSYTE